MWRPNVSFLITVHLTYWGKSAKCIVQLFLLVYLIGSLWSSPVSISCVLEWEAQCQIFSFFIIFLLHMCMRHSVILWYIYTTYNHPDTVLDISISLNISLCWELLDSFLPAFYKSYNELLQTNYNCPTVWQDTSPDYALVSWFPPHFPPLPSLALIRTSLSSSRKLYFFQLLNISENNWHLTFCVCLISLNTVLSSSTHTAINDSSSCFLMTRY